MTAQGQNRLKTKGAIDLLILATIAIIAAAIPVTTSFLYLLPPNYFLIDYLSRHPLASG